jgi:hypothetical protein
MKKIKIKIGQLFDFLNFKSSGNKEDSFKTKEDIFVKNHNNEFVPIREFIIKKEDSYRSDFKNVLYHISSDEHILLTEDGEKKIKDITQHDNILLKDDDGNETTTNLLSYSLHKKNDVLYDFCLDYPHLFKTTNGLIHHNSLSIYAIIRLLRAINKKILLVVPNIGLVEQMYSDFDSYGHDNLSREVEKLYARYSDDFRKHDAKPVLISTYQSIIKKRSDFFKEFDCVIVDECHGTKSDSKSLQQILKACTNADYRFGFTGTLPDEKADLYTIHGYIGPTLFSIKAGELIDKGVLSKIKIANIIMKYPLSAIKECHGRDYNFEVDYVMQHAPRNKVLNFILDNTPDTLNTLILVSRIEKHLKPLIAFLEKKYPNKEILVVYGGVDALEREKIRKKMESKTGLILIATYQTLSTGWNVKNLHQIVFFASYKAKITVLQSIGRGLRTHESKEHLILFDCVDDLTYKKRTGTVHKNYIYEHFLKRLEYYKYQGFNYINKVINL